MNPSVETLIFLINQYRKATQVYWFTCRDFDEFDFSRGLSADDPHLLLCRQTVTQSDTTKEQQQSSVVKLVSCVNTSHARVIGEMLL